MVIVAGLGFTGTRLARRLLERGVETWAPVRGIARFGNLANAGLRLIEIAEIIEGRTSIPEGAAMALLIPPLPDLENDKLREWILRSKPQRIVYVSSTGVYGDQTDVDADTPARPNDERGVRRIEEERWVAGGPWSSLILRAAAIYGPGRGVHAAVREGRTPRGANSGLVSRVHVDDLAAIIEAGLFSNISGAWPVADEEACPTSEIVRWCFEVAGMKPPARGATATAPPLTQGRKIDGSKIREILDVALKYPDWRSGVAASLREEQSLGSDLAVGNQ
ncbi:MAG TPA: hypothetical protein VG297_21890 [Bryobacteraceae bacterium]|jgi:nucleoside-diphosphate-sugar epimerase|nr:hypothetical protein [Bryobacteraceae bacterium]